MTFNYPQGDDWWLEDKEPQSQYYGRKFHFDFSEINGDEIDLCRALHKLIYAE